MQNHFEDCFEVLLAETVSDAQVRYGKQNPDYEKKSNRMAEIEEILTKLLADQSTGPSPNYWALAREYFQLESETYYPSHTATYIQGMFDSISLLARLGYFKQC